MQTEKLNPGQYKVAATGFLSLFSVVGIMFYGIPFFFDFWVKDFNWSRATVTSGNMFGKIIIGPLFGFAAGWFVDRFGPRRLLLAGILMAGAALVGLGSAATLTAFYAFYLLNALGNVCGGPLPNQVLLSRWFDRDRGKAMGFAYLGIGIGGTLVPLIATALITSFGWRTALQVLGVLMVLIAFPVTWFVRDSPEQGREDVMGTVPRGLGTVPRDSHGRPSAFHGGQSPLSATLKSPAFYLLLVGSMCSIAAVGGTVQNLKLFLTIDLKLSQLEVARIASLVLFSSLAGRIMMGYLADKWSRKHVMI